MDSRTCLRREFWTRVLAIQPALSILIYRTSHEQTQIIQSLHRTQCETQAYSTICEPSLRLPFDTVE
jgi:hypothetical protein